MTVLKTPESLAEEHEEIFTDLRQLAKLNSETGSATRELLSVLEPHFQKEEMLAMPLLGALQSLSTLKDKEVREILFLHEDFGKGYSGMLKDHKKIVALIDKTRKAAKKDGRPDAFAVLDGLKHHARVEEEVLYPAAMLVGTYLWSMRATKAKA